jgi:hypothetical protein
MEEITNFLSENPIFDVNALIKFIYSTMKYKSYHHRIHYKNYDSDLIQIYTESSQEYTKWPIFNACRSIIINTKLNNIVSFSHPNIEYLEYEDAKKYLNETQKFTESHEGTLISIFYHNNMWHYSTRRQLDMYKTHNIIYGKKSELSHGQMFEEALDNLSLTKEQFEASLTIGNQYYVELVHYQNSFNISYEILYGEKYAQVFLLHVRNENNELIEDSNCKISINQEIDYDVVISKLDNPEVVMEGYIFTRVDENNNNILCKVMHPSYYDKMKFNSGFKTRQEQYIHLFQKNLLKQYIENNPYSKVSSTGENIELVGLVTYIFKFVGQRMLDIYYKFNNNNMVHRNEDLFRKSFLENKDYSLIFYTLGMMKGIHKNKQLNINEMRTFLKYKIVASDIWKLLHEIMLFEDNGLNPLVNAFLE